MKLVEFFKRWWQEAAPLARAGLVVGGLAMVASLVYMASSANANAPIPLFVGMSADRAAALARELEARRVSYEMRDNGTTIAVRMPRDAMHKLRLELTSEGHDVGSVTTWDIFDDSSVTLTEFERKVMYQRALQGELSRTIADLPQVKSARVHLALPNNSLLERNKGEPTASVYISLVRGRSIDERVASGIAHLVASSVPELSANKIAILDGTGTMIREPDDGTGGGKKLLEIKESRERKMEKSIVSLLEKTVGPGHVLAKVAVDMDMTRVSETLEQYDADNTALRSARKTTEDTSTERTEPNAAAGVQGNLPQVPGPEGPEAPKNKSTSNRSIDTKEYAVPRTVRQVQKPLGEIRKISIAVLVDSNPFTAAPAAPSEEDEAAEEGVEVPAGVESPGGDATRPLMAQPSPEMLSALVQSAVGFDAARGDHIEISFVPFVLPDTKGGDEVQYVENPLEMWLWILMVFLIGTALVTTSIGFTERRRREAAIAEYARQLQEKESELQKKKEEEEGAVPNSSNLRKEVRELTAKNVAATVEVMKGWLRPTLGRN